MATARPRLGELLLASGVCSREQLREAWEQKVLYGDRLGTNLLATGVIDEERLASALGQQLGVHSGHGKVIKPEPSALAMVPKNVAIRRLVVPHHVVDKQLYVLMRDPHDPTALEEVAFAASLRVVPVVVCEARMWSLLERHYKSVVSLRPVPLDGPPRVRSAALDDPTAGAAALGPELTSEEEFHRLYAGIHAASPSLASIPQRPAEVDHDIVPPPITPLPDASVEAHGAHTALSSSDEDTDVDKTSPARPAAILAERDPDGREGVLAPPKTSGEGAREWRETIEQTQPMMARPRLTSDDGEATDAGQPKEGASSIIDLVEVSSELPQTPIEAPLERQQTADFHVEIEAIVDESPLSFADASKVLTTALDRTAIARTVLRAARTRFARACLLAVYPDRIVGWMGIGDGMQSERMRDVVIPRADKSVFSLVADSRSHYLGPLARLPAHGRWVKATGRKIPKSLAVFPILVRGRPVNLLVVDNGHDEFVSSDVGEVLILAQQIAKTYETLLTGGA